ncbi:MAG TPA: NmrA/HSCARG family protein [Stellaceae bacterium]|nr:NmrA/HSCARG family protein [Stellaceae bacterium]
MTILVTGSTGTIGSQVVTTLAGKGVQIRALTRSPEKTSFPAGVVPVKGDPSDVESLRTALAGVSTLFLLIANVPDELTQALITLNLAREAGVRGVVYLSVFKGADYTDVPHFTGKHAVERMIEASDMPATILRPGYYIQNDMRQKDALLGNGLYAMPIGSAGVSMVDTRDIAQIAAQELLRREQSEHRLPSEVIDLVGPDSLTSAALADIWTEVLERPIRYIGDDLDAMEQRMKTFAPGWLAYDMRLMLARYQRDGAVATPAALERLTALLGHAPRSYRDFAVETAKQWAVAPAAYNA